MNEEALKQWRLYVQSLADLLGLKDWTLDLKVGGIDEEVIAMVFPIEGRKRATLKLCEEWLDLTAEDQRHTIAHELIHLHLIGATDIIRLDTIKQLSQASYDVLWEGFKRQVEYGVDGLADAIAPFLPLP